MPDLCNHLGHAALAGSASTQYHRRGTNRATAMMHRPVLTPPAAHSPAHADHATQAPIGAVGAGRTEGPAEEKSFDAAMVQAAMLIAASKMSGNVKLAKAMTRATRTGT